MRKTLALLALPLAIISSCKPDTTKTPEPEQPELHQFEPVKKQVHEGTTDISLKSKDGNIVSAGRDANGGFVLRKISMLIGNTLWTKTIPVVGLTEISSMAEAADGDILVVGVAPSTEQKPIITVSAHSSDGDAKWHKQYGHAAAHHSAPQIVRLHDNKLLIAAKSSYMTTVLLRVVIQSNGDIVSTRSADMSVGQHPRMTVLGNGTVVLVSTVGNVMKHPYLIRMHGDGDILADHSITTPGNTYVMDITEINDGELLLCGTREETGQNDKGFVMKVTAALTESETKIFSRTQGHVGISAIKLTDEGYTAVGSVSDLPADVSQNFLVTCKLQGDVVREKVYPMDGGKAERLNDVWQQDKNFVMLGNRANQNGTAQEYLVTGDSK